MVNFNPKNIAYASPSGSFASSTGGVIPQQGIQQAQAPKETSITEIIQKLEIQIQKSETQQQNAVAPVQAQSVQPVVPVQNAFGTSGVPQQAIAPMPMGALAAPQQQAIAPMPAGTPLAGSSPQAFAPVSNGLYNAPQQAMAPVYTQPAGTQQTIQPQQQQQANTGKTDLLKTLKALLSTIQNGNTNGVQKAEATEGKDVKQLLEELSGLLQQAQGEASPTSSDTSAKKGTTSKDKTSTQPDLTIDVIDGNGKSSKSDNSGNSSGSSSASASASASGDKIIARGRDGKEREYKKQGNLYYNPDAPYGSRKLKNPKVQEDSEGNKVAKSGKLSSPLILDTNKDGKVGAEKGKGVDIDGDGKADGAASGGDKMLSLGDVDGDGKITGKEVLGNETVDPFTGQKLNAKNGFDALEKIAQSAEKNTGIKCTDGDGQVDLKKLKEAMQKSGKGNLGYISGDNNTKLESLESQDASKINTKQYKNVQDSGDVQHNQLGSYTDNSGNERKVDDVWFRNVA